MWLVIVEASGSCRLLDGRARKIPRMGNELWVWLLQLLISSRWPLAQSRNCNNCKVWRKSNNPLGNTRVLVAVGGTAHDEEDKHCLYSLRESSHSSAKLSVQHTATTRTHPPTSRTATSPKLLMIRRATVLYVQQFPCVCYQCHMYNNAVRATVVYVHQSVTSVARWGGTNG